jgi:hypothetical protein
MRRWIALCGAFTLLALSAAGIRGQQSCNPIVCENQLPGAPASQWDISGSGDSSLQGFATDISVNKGDTVHFKVNTTASSFRVDIYRLGYYSGMGARLVASPGTFASVSQPSCLTQSSTGLIDCGKWSESASWAVPSTAVSGIYLAKLTRPDTQGSSHIAFVVRDDAAAADILFQTSDTTWQAYNQYGGNSLYVGGPGTNPGRAYKVSYNRPFTTRGTGPEDWLFNAEYPMVRWLEANGYNVSYFTGVDTDRSGATELFRHRVFLSVGHDEYWSGPQRANVEAARGGGVNLAFFSGNEIFWKTRWESSIDGTSTPYRTLVSYKETHANAVIDPADPPTWTGTWRDPRFSPPADGGRPENALTGTIFTVNCCSTTAAIRVTQAFASQPFWRNTRVATLPSGGSTTLTTGTLGYEWDENLNNGFRPAGLTPLSSTTLSVNQKLQDYGSTYASGSATHVLTLYRYLSGALVFGAGTVQWSWGLDGNHDRGGSTPDLAMQQATVNLLSDMGVSPGSLQPNLVPGTPDTTPPTVTVTAPTGGTTVSGSVGVTATAGDNVGVAGVQFKVDGANLGAEVTSAPYSVAWDSTSATNASHSLTAVARDTSGNLTTSVAVVVTVSNTPAAFTTVRINAGGPSFIDSANNAWAADKNFSGGSTYTKANAIAGTVDDTLFQSERYGNFSYNIPVPNGTYAITLRFAEIYWTSAGKRVFNVTVEGQTVISNLDIYAAAGANTALDRVVQATVTDGTLNIGFVTVVDNAKVSAIQVAAAAGVNQAPSVNAGPDQSITLPANSVALAGTASDDGLPSPPAALTYAWSMFSGPAAVTFSAPSSLNTNATFTAAGTYTLRLTVSDSQLVTTDDLVVTVNGGDVTPPTLTITAPANNATVSGSSVPVSATAGDNIAVVGVQFKVDGNNLGAEDTSSPYGVTWNTTTASNSSHTVSATARDAAGNTTTKSVTVNVSNVGPSNLTVDGSTSFQAIDGFGININSKLWNNGELIGGINQLVDLMGISMARVDVLTNSWWELGNDDADPQNYNWTYYNRLFDSTNFRDVWNTIEYLNRRNVTVIMSAQGLLPAWMGGTTLNTAQEDEFAEMFSAAVYYARVTRGLTIPYIDPMNEIDLGMPEGPSVDAAQYARVLRKIMDRLVTLGLGDIKIVPPETVVGDEAPYISAVVADTVLAAHVDTVGVHSYNGTTPLSSGLAGRRLWMTEWSESATDGFLDGGQSVANEWNFAKTEADYLLGLLSNGASAALKWDAIDNIHEHNPSGNVTKWGALAYDFTTHTMSPRKRLYASGLVFRFVQPGMTRIGVSTTSGVTVYGFYDSVLGKLTFVGHNTSGSAVVLNGALSNVGTVTTLNSYTTDSANANITRGADVAVSGGSFSYSVPADTFFALSSGTLPASPDTQPPTVSFSAPSGGGPVSGVVAVVANATDDRAISAVQFTLDGQLFDVAFDAPFSTSIDTQFLINGNHTVNATAWDGASNSKSAALVLNVNNASSKSLVAAYAFNENTGLVANDASGNSGAGFLNGAGWTSSGKFGSGVTFNGASLVIVNDSPYLHLSTGMTLEAWVNPSSTSGSQAIIYKEWTGVPSWSLYSASGVPQAQFTSSLMTTTSLAGGGSLPSNTWTHVALTYDGTSARFYVNGTLTATRAATVPFSANNPLYIGGNVFHGDYFAGSIDEVRIYSRVLTAAEIQGDMTVAINADTIPPTVTLTAPGSGNTVSGTTVALSANANDNNGVAGVQFKVDGVNVGAEDTLPPYSAVWDSTLVSNGPHTVSATARDTSGNTTTASAPVTVSNPLAISNIAVSNITATSATIGWQTNGVADSQVRFGLVVPYSSATTLDSNLVLIHSQTLSGLTPASLYHYQVLSNGAAGSAASSDGTFTTANASDTTAPTVSITAPSAGATVSGTNVAVSANAADNVAVAGVQFKLDGVNLGAEDTTAPYGVTWDTTAASNGTHTLSAVARDAANNTATASISVTVSNAQVPLAIDAAVSGDQPSSAVRTVTASVTTAGANELLLALIAADDSSAGNTVTGISGGGLTWQFVARANGSRGVSEVWRTWASAKLTGAAVTATLAQGAASSMTVVALTGTDSTGTSGSGAIGAVKSASATGAPTGTVVTTRNNSLVFGVGNDWDQPTSRTLGPGQTMVHQYLAPVGDTYWVQRLTATTPAAGTSVTVNDVSPTADQYNLVVVEVLGK